MNDRQLLELAAKAAGIEGCYCERKLGEAVISFGIAGNCINGADVLWNPLSGDGDALRLAVSLKLDVLQHSDGNGCFAGTHDRKIGSAEYFIEQDKHTATRRAIVRAAAKIGESMSTQEQGV
jgi:hypothetical protein